MCAAPPSCSPVLNISIFQYFTKYVYILNFSHFQYLWSKFRGTASVCVHMCMFCERHRHWILKTLSTICTYKFTTGRQVTYKYMYTHTNSTLKRTEEATPTLRLGVSRLWRLLSVCGATVGGGHGRLGNRVGAGLWVRRLGLSTWTEEREKIMHFIIPYSRKIWRGIKFGGLAVYITTAKLKSAKISYSHIYVWRSHTEPPNLNPLIFLQ